MAQRSVLKALLRGAVIGAGAPLLAGCLLAAAGAGAGGGYALTQERSISDTVKDAGIQAVVEQSWKNYNVRLSEDIKATVYEGRVLITGDVPNEDWHQQAVKLAWKADGVKEVYDEIQVGPEEGFGQDMGDVAISSKLKAQLIGDGDVKSINYTITTEKGVVYIIGSARSQAELDRVVDHARNISDVRRVVSYVRIRSGTPPSTEAASAAPAAAAPSPAPASPPPGDTPVSAPTPRQEIEVTPLK